MQQSESSGLERRTPAAEINLLDYLEVMVGNWRLVAKTAAAAAVVSIAFSLALPDSYISKSLILPPQQDNSGMMGLLMGGAGGIGGMAADLLGKGTPADLCVAILNSEAVADRIIDRFHLMELYEQKYRVETYKALAKKVVISAGKKDGIITVSVEDQDPKRAAEMANAYVEELGRLTAKLDVTGAMQDREFYAERVAKARVDLARAEDALKAFQSRSKVLDITEQAKGTIKGVAELEGQLALEEVKLAGLRRSLTDNSSEVKGQLAVIANMKSQLARLEGNRSGSAIPGAGSIPELGVQYLRLMREFKIQEAIVEMLTKQYELAKFSEAKDGSSIQIIQQARVPDKKAKPKRGLIVVGSTCAAALATLIYAFIRDAAGRMRQEDRDRWNRMKEQLPVPFKKMTGP